jgi:hypothetical protein
MRGQRSILKQLGVVIALVLPPFVAALLFRRNEMPTCEQQYYT